MSQIVYTGIDQESMVTVNEETIVYRENMTATAAGGGCLWGVTPLDASAGPLSVIVRCTGYTNGLTVSSAGSMTIQITYPPNSSQPTPVLVFYQLPGGGDSFQYSAGGRSAVASSCPPPRPACPQLVHVNPGDCSVLRVPNRPDCYSYSAGMQVRVFGGGYNWDVEASHTPPGCPLHLKVRCRGEKSPGSGAVKDGHLSVYIQSPRQAHQPQPAPVYYLRGSACPPAGPVVTHLPG